MKLMARVLLINLIFYIIATVVSANDDPVINISPIYLATSEEGDQNQRSAIIQGASTNSMDLLLMQNEKDAMLECTLENAPNYDEFVLQWFQKGQHVPIGSSGDRVFTDFILDRELGRVRRILHFLPLNHRDAGTYTCRANLGTKQLKKDIVIRVREEPRFRMQGRVGGNVGEPLTLDCSATGLSKVSYIMIMDERGQSINESHGFLVAGTEVTIKNLTEAHQNTKIVCLAVQNERLSETDSQTATYRNELTIDVWYAPKFLYTKIDRHAVNGQNVTILCNVVRSNPRLQHLVIKKDGKEIFEDERHKYQIRGDQKRLLIIAVEDDDYGKYICEAHNGKLSSKQIIVLSKAWPPKQPKVDLYSMTNDSITWRIMENSGDGFLPVQSYIISYREARKAPPHPRNLDIVNENSTDEADMNADEWINNQQFPKSFSNLYVISGLQPLMAYEFEFVAHNEIANGDPITQKAIPGALPKSPYSSASNKISTSFFTFTLVFASKIALHVFVRLIAG